MKRYIYLRVSSEQQSFDQQHHCIYEYFKKVGIEPQSVSAQVVEKVSGTIKHTDRKLSSLIDRCKQGDVMFVSELSRISRTMSDLFAIVTECAEKGVTIIQCKDGSTIENESIGGKALLFALSLAAEIEVNNIRQRTNMGLDVRKKRQAKGERWISNTGRECDRLGRPADGIDEHGKPYWDLSAANEASCIAKQEAAIRWREQSAAYKMVREWRAMGKTRNEMLAELQRLYEHAPEKFGTPKGRCVTRSVLDRWCREMNPLAV
jgi:DNA invertase Pin-like site-specific DNA recombinase